MPQPLKDGLDRRAVARIAGAFERAEPRFDATAFCRACGRGLGGLALKARVVHIAAALRTHLPADYPAALAVILRAARDWPPAADDAVFPEFAAWPMTDFVGLYGLDHPVASLAALKRLTPLFTAEFAIRPFLVAHTDLTLATLGGWTDNPDEHVRRLISEGTRPRLPWGVRLKAFQADPRPMLALIEGLRDDPSEYVRRSVANHLNDIAKDHPDTVVSVCRRWQKGAAAEHRWIIRHATRTLVKAGHPGALALLGYDTAPRVKVERLRLAPGTLAIGGALAITFRVVSTAPRPQRLVVDYIVHHRGASGALRPKVFKLRTLDLTPHATVALTKRHAFKPITTRRYYAGTQAVELMINGRSLAKRTFRLTDAG